MSPARGRSVEAAAAPDRLVQLRVREPRVLGWAGSGVLGFTLDCGGEAVGEAGAADRDGAARLRGGPGWGGNPVRQMSATHWESVR